MASSFLLQVFLLVSTSFHTHLPEWGCKFITQAHRERQTLGEFETLPAATLPTLHRGWPAISHDALTGPAILKYAPSTPLLF